MHVPSVDIVAVSILVSTACAELLAFFLHEQNEASRSVSLKNAQ